MRLPRQAPPVDRRADRAKGVVVCGTGGPVQAYLCGRMVPLVCVPPALLRCGGVVRSIGVVEARKGP